MEVIRTQVDGQTAVRQMVEEQKADGEAIIIDQLVDGHQIMQIMEERIVFQKEPFGIAVTAGKQLQLHKEKEADDGQIIFLILRAHYLLQRIPAGQPFKMEATKLLKEEPGQEMGVQGVQVKRCHT